MKIERYCPQCGKKMILKKTISHYNPITGIPIYEIVGKCSGNNFFKRHLDRIY